MCRTWLLVIGALATIALPASAADDWNALLQEHIDSTNLRLQTDRKQLTEEQYHEFLVHQRIVDEEIAAKCVAFAEQSDTAAFLSYMALEMVLTDPHAGPVGERASELIVADHFDDRSIKDLAWRLSLSRPVSLASERVLRSIIENSGSREAIAMASVGLGRFLREKAEAARVIARLPRRRAAVEAEFGKYYIDQLDTMDVGACEREAAEVLATVKEDYADVNVAGDRNLREIAEKELIHLRYGQPGRKAQEIVGVDVNGETLRLSDHDGKVRVLLFWGHWCGPCRKGYPTYRALVARYPQQSFAFLGIDSDKEKSTLQRVITSGDVTWPCWWDGGEEPMPIHEQWALAGAPHVFVLDGDGRIRFTDVRGRELEEAVELLMSER